MARKPQNRPAATFTPEALGFTEPTETFTKVEFTAPDGDAFDAAHDEATALNAEFDAYQFELLHDEAHMINDANEPTADEPAVKSLQPAWAQAAEAEVAADPDAPSDVRLIWCRNFIKKNITKPTWAHAAALTDEEILKIIGGAQTYVTTIQKFRRLMKAAALAPVVVEAVVEVPEGLTEVVEPPVTEQPAEELAA